MLEHKRSTFVPVAPQATRLVRSRQSLILGQELSVRVVTVHTTDCTLAQPVGVWASEFRNDAGMAAGALGRDVGCPSRRRAVRPRTVDGMASYTAHLVSRVATVQPTRLGGLSTVTG